MSDKPKAFEFSIEQQLTNLVCKHAFIDKADEYFSSDCIGLMRKDAIAILDGIGFYARDEKIKAMQAEIDKRDVRIRELLKSVRASCPCKAHKNECFECLDIEKELNQRGKDEN